MDDLLNDFLIETAEHIEAATMELVQLEKEPANRARIASLFRHIHTIKGASGFLTLPRVGRLAHVTEALIGGLRDGALATTAQITLIFAAIDRLKSIVAEMGQSQSEPDGDDGDLIRALEAATNQARPVAPEPAAAQARQSEAERPAALPEIEAVEADWNPQPLSETPAANPSHIGEMVRVSVAVLDRLMGIVSELVSTRNQLLELSSAAGDETVMTSVQTLSSITSDLQDAVMSARMQPVGRLFSSFPRLVRDLSLDLDKKITLVTEGAETELDRQVIEHIRAPLTHIIRNCADHGIERPAERLAAGKSETGLICVRAAYDAGQITIDITDDGRGLDVARIRARALARGIASEAEFARMAEADILQIVFLPGFSTADAVTKISGRGVGMDIVREDIQSIGGTVALASRHGQGTTVTLRIPLTLAITPALILGSAGLRFAIPQMAVVELVGVGDGFEHVIQYIYDAPVLRLREDVLPLIDLAGVLRLHREDTDEARNGFVAVLRVGANRFGLLVDVIADVQEIVIEPLVSALARLGIFSGQTILGDGSAVLILDPATLMEHAAVQNAADCVPPAPTPEIFIPAPEKTRIILFRAGSGPLKALPLSLVLRIEEAERHRLVASNGTFVLPHEQGLLPVMPVTNDIALDRAAYPILIVSGAGQTIGLLVEEIVDLTDEYLHLQMENSAPHILGSLQLQGAVVDFLDATYFMKLACPAALARGVSQRHKVLLVDDKAFFRDMLAPIFVAAGYDVTSASSAQEALSFMKKGMPVHVVVTDIDMPDMDGYNFARALHQLPGRADLPVVALAAQATPSVIAAAKACGVNAVAGKFDRTALLDIVAPLLDAVETTPLEIERRIISELAA